MSLEDLHDDLSGLLDHVKRHFRDPAGTRVTLVIRQTVAPKPPGPRRRR